MHFPPSRQEFYATIVAALYRERTPCCSRHGPITFDVVEHLCRQRESMRTCSAVSDEINNLFSCCIILWLFSPVSATRASNSRSSFGSRWVWKSVKTAPSFPGGQTFVERLTGGADLACTSRLPVLVLAAERAMFLGRILIGFRHCCTAIIRTCCCLSTACTTPESVRSSPVAACIASATTSTAMTAVAAVATTATATARGVTRVKRVARRLLLL